MTYTLVLLGDHLGNNLTSYSVMIIITILTSNPSDPHIWICVILWVLGYVCRYMYVLICNCTVYVPVCMMLWVLIYIRTYVLIHLFCTDICTLSVYAYVFVCVYTDVDVTAVSHTRPFAQKREVPLHQDTTSTYISIYIPMYIWT